MKKFDDEIAKVRERFEKTGYIFHLVHLRNLRIRFGQKISERPRAKSAPSITPTENPFPEIQNDIPEMAYKDMTPEILRGAIQHQGALIVRDFISKDAVKSLRDGIDNTFEDSAEFFAKPKSTKQGDNPNSRWFQLDLPVKDIYTNNDVAFMLQTGSV